MADEHDINCPCSYCECLRDPDREDGDLESLTDAQKAMGISHMWIRRRAKDARFRFPEIVRLGRRVFIHKRHRQEWMRSPHARLTTAFNAPEKTA